MPASATARLAPPPYLTDSERWKVLASSWMLQANQGHLANTGTVTCSSGTAQTVLVDTRIGAFVTLAFMPTTANAAAEAVTMYVASLSKGGATITHANAASGDRTFRYAIFG